MGQGPTDLCIFTCLSPPGAASHTTRPWSLLPSVAPITQRIGHTGETLAWSKAEGTHRTGLQGPDLTCPAKTTRVATEAHLPPCCPAKTVCTSELSRYRTHRPAGLDTVRAPQQWAWPSPTPRSLARMGVGDTGPRAGTRHLQAWASGVFSSAWRTPVAEPHV